MTKEGMADSIQAAISAIGQIQSEGGSPDPIAQSRLYLEAWCEGIIAELIKANITGLDSRGDTHDNLSIS